MLSVPYNESYAGNPQRQTREKPHIDRSGLKTSMLLIPFTVIYRLLDDEPSRFSAHTLYVPPSHFDTSFIVIEWPPELSDSTCARASRSITSSSLYHVIEGEGNPAILQPKVTVLPSSTVSVAGRRFTNSGAGKNIDACYQTVRSMYGQNITHDV